MRQLKRREERQVRGISKERKVKLVETLSKRLRLRKEIKTWGYDKNNICSLVRVQKTCSEVDLHRVYRNFFLPDEDKRLKRNR